MVRRGFSMPTGLLESALVAPIKLHAFTGRIPILDTEDTKSKPAKGGHAEDTEDLATLGGQV